MATLGLKPGPQPCFLTAGEVTTVAQTNQGKVQRVGCVKPRTRLTYLDPVVKLLRLSPRVVEQIQQVAP